MGKLLGVLAVVVLAGCGGDGGGGAGDGSDRERIEAVLMGYLEDLADGDAEGACSRLSQAAQRDIAVFAGAASCPEAVDQLHDTLEDEDRDKLLDARVERITIDGTSARGAMASGDVIPLEKVDGTWKIKSFASGGGYATQAQAACVVGGMQSFDDGEANRFWLREGRKDFREFLVRVCRRADAKGLLVEGKEPGAEFKRLAGRVLVEMIREGTVRRPR